MRFFFALLRHRHSGRAIIAEKISNRSFVSSPMSTSCVIQHRRKVAKMNSGGNAVRKNGGATKGKESKVL